MGIIRNGGNGAFSGKAGSFIGSNWKNVSYIKGIPKLSTKPATLKQLQQRDRFALAMGFLGPVKEIIKIGFKGQEKERASGFNLAVQHVLNFALVGDYPNYSIDRSKVLFAKGTLTPPNSVVLNSPAPAKIKITYSNTVNDLTAFADDGLVVLLYCEENMMFMPYLNMAKRSDGELLLEVPTEFAGKEVDVNLFFAEQNSNRCSISVLAGTVMVSS